MDISRTMYFKQIHFPPGAFQEAVGLICDYLKLPRSISAVASYDHGDGMREDRRLGYEQLGAVRSICTTPESIRFNIKPPDAIFISINLIIDDRLSFYVSANSVVICNAILNIFRDTLKLEEVRNIIDEPPAQVIDSKTPTVPPPLPPPDIIPPSRSDKLEYPEKITVAWLVKHAPIQLWLWLIGAFAAVFIAGIKIASIEEVRDIFK